MCVALGKSKLWEWFLSENSSRLMKAFTVGFASNLCSLTCVYYVVLGYFVALGVNWDLWGGPGFGFLGFWLVSLLIL